MASCHVVKEIDPSFVPQERNVLPVIQILLWLYAILLDRPIYVEETLLYENPHQCRGHDLSSGISFVQGLGSVCKVRFMH
jgi:hypothetical protein